MALNGLSVLVTRPRLQAQGVCNLIEQAQGKAIHFPVIDIEAVATDYWTTAELETLDAIIFVSRNAVDYFVQDNRYALPDKLQLIAVGDGSAESMLLNGLRVDFRPTQSIGSEGLLLMPELEDMSDKKVLIVRGKGGRELLADTLKERGAEVDYIEVYQRVLPTPSALQCEQAVKADAVMCTSIEGVTNLSLLLQQRLSSLFAKPLLVISERIKKYAESMGFEQVWVTKDTSDNAIIELLNQWKENNVEK